MTNESHSLLDRHASARHAGDGGHSRRMKREVRANTLPVAFRSAFEEQGPVSGCEGVMSAGALYVSGLQLANQGQKAGVKSRREYLGVLGVKRNALGVEVDIVQGKAGFAKPASLMECDFKRDRHPTHRKGQVPFLRDEGLANGGDIGLGHLEFFRRSVTLDAHPLKRVGRDETAMHGFTHDPRQEPQFSQSRVVRGMPFGDALNLTRAGGDVVQAELIRDTVRSINIPFGQERVEPLPSVTLRDEGLGAVVMLHFQPNGDPALPAGVRRDGSGGECIGRKFAGHRDGALVPEGVVAPLSTALAEKAKAFRAPVFDPPEWGVFAGVNACASQAHVAVAERSYRHFSTKNNHC